MDNEEQKTEIPGNKVPVFLGWSGKASNQTAKVLHKYLPSIINALDPFISDEDIEKGSVWRDKIAKELEKSECGILCLTPDNVNSLWIHFEAGALSKRFVESRACTFLMGLSQSEFDGPLTDFQSTSLNKEDFFKLIKSLNSACGNLSQSEKRLKISFDALWPQIEGELIAIEKSIKKSKSPKTNSSKKQDDASTHIRPDLLEELVVRLRTQDQRLSNMESEIKKSSYSEVKTPSPSMRNKLIRRTFAADVKRFFATIDIKASIMELGDIDEIMSVQLSKNVPLELWEQFGNKFSSALRNNNVQVFFYNKDNIFLNRYP